MIERWSSDAVALVAIASGTVLSAAFFAGADAPVRVSGAVVEPAAAGPAQAGVAFYASSVDGFWTVTGDYGGRIARRGDDLSLHVPDAHVVFSMREETVPARLDGIRLALAEESFDGWRVVRSGPLRPVGAEILPGTDLWLSGLDLELPDVPEGELVGRWLVIVHEITTVDEHGRATTARTYAHADEGILDRLVGYRTEGC